LLFSLIFFDVFRLLYIWYHYWNISIPEKPEDFKNLTVDVLTTFCSGEPIDMVTETLLAIKKIKYPHTTYLCDEEDNTILKAFCIKNDIVHVTRNNRIDAKAGNINNALKIAKGEICLILDPDHIPAPNFLDEVLPYFADNKIGFVQTVQSYYNIEESKVAQAAAEQTFQFYGPVMMSMNTYGTVNAIGANCVFRREALDSIKGHAVGLSEDMHTAMKLHSKGWKSIYVPKALSAGLVPHTLSSYYKQQLKWSRGTFELLISSYPKLFKSFSLRQKIHYGILPFHYLAGFFFMISFLIPIISLFFSTSPLKGNIVNFGLIIAPILISLLAIRFYSQRWLIKKKERGFHFLGGLLLQCTWWIYINGVLFTLLRKNVPYLPTLKNDDKTTHLSIVLPNLIVGVICITSIIYGLMADFTPFSMMMSGFALWNAAILFITLSFAFERKKKLANLEKSKNGKTFFKEIRQKAFTIGNKFSLPFVVLAIFLSIIFQIKNEEFKNSGFKTKSEVHNNLKYLGIFSPQKDNGISSIKNVADQSIALDQKFDIVSFYITWNKNIDSSFQWKTLDSVYNQESLPLITWEPWLNTFENELDTTYHVNDLILSGYFDNYIKAFSLKLKHLNKPVFLRFAHEFDNPFYPWYDDRENASILFKKAWIHVRTIFKKNGVSNVIWVWNPWKSENVFDYFPGEHYVDWMGVNILNYATFGNKNYNQFHELYTSFHKEFKRLPEKPVMITEFGTLNDGLYQNQWINKGFEVIKEKFTEIDALIYFDSNVDNNNPDGIETNDYFNWTIAAQNSFKNTFKSVEIPNYIFTNLTNFNSETPLKLSNSNGVKDIKGVNFIKGEKWDEDYHVLSRAHLISDFREIENAGINTIKFKDNPVYRYNVINLSKKFDLDISYAFEIPLKTDFVNDLIVSANLKTDILKVIEKYKNESQIISWHIQNDVLNNLQKYFNKPELIYNQQAYLYWLNDLIKEIRKIDSSRPLIIDLEINKNTVEHSKMILSSIQEFITIGLIVKHSEYNNEAVNYFNQINQDYIYSVIDLKSMEDLNLIQNNISFYLTSWQDQHRINYVSFNGLVDRKGRLKSNYFKLKSLINSKNAEYKSLNVKIIGPLRVITEGFPGNFHALILNKNKDWLYAEENNNLKFEWSLIKYDLNDNFISIKELGNKPMLYLEIPENYDSYRLQLTVIDGDVSKSHITSLNTPYVLK